MNLFLKPSLKNDFPQYVIRRSILSFLKKNIHEFKGTVIDLGCGNMPYKELIQNQSSVIEYITIDWPKTKYYQNKPDLYWNGNTIPLKDNSADCILLTEVIEHLDNPLVVLKEISRVLKTSGILLGTTPFFWPLHEVPNDIQRLTPFGLQRLFKSSGFSNQKITASGGWRLSFAQFLCLYISFGIKSELLKKAMKIILHYPILLLSKHDKEIKDFTHMQMISLICFKATK